MSDSGYIPSGIIDDGETTRYLEEGFWSEAENSEKVFEEINWENTEYDEETVRNCISRNE